MNYPSIPVETKQFDNLTKQQMLWKKRNRYYYSDIKKLYSFIIPPGSTILELGCGDGDLLESLRKNLNCNCVGIDSSETIINNAKRHFPLVEFRTEDITKINFEEKFEFIILSDLVGVVSDVQIVFENMRKLCTSETRIIINFYNFLWEPLLNISRKLNLISPTKVQNWLSISDIKMLLELTNFEVVKSGSRLLLPKYLPGVSELFNNYFAKFPFLKKLCLYNYIVARPLDIKQKNENEETVSVVIPARNEKGNIESAILRTPQMGMNTELIFVEGNSTDGTFEEIKLLAKKYNFVSKNKCKIRYTRQEGHGKGDAVRKGFELSRGDILMILDADLTVAPEELPKFYKAITSGKGEFINGTRLVYPMETEAMRSLNLLGNKIFSLMFTWLLDQRFKDTLCGTKVISRKNYEKLKKSRLYFGNFDPFGDFDLIFGASKLNLKIVEIPIHYKEREYGTTNISRFKHGWLLIKMCIFAMKKIKFI